MKKILPFSFLMLALQSCSNFVPYTMGVKEELEESNVKIHQTQFYLKQPIVLQRILETSNLEIEKGNLESKSVRTRDIIKFWDGKSIKGLGRIFENSLHLVFEKDNPLKMTEKNGTFYFHVPSKKIAYDGGFYNVAKGGRWNKVYIKKKDYVKYKKQYRRVKGLEVNH